jgi:tetratricopeptide (TPR) repeat protein
MPRPGPDRRPSRPRPPSRQARSTGGARGSKAARAPREANAARAPREAGQSGRVASRPRSVEEEIRATARPKQSERAVRAFQQAVALMERGRDAAAVGPAREAKDLAPRSGVVREVLGMALYRSGQFRDALRELQAYRRISGRTDQNHLIADSHRALGAPEKAIEPVREALRARIGDDVRAEAAVVGASALADLGRMDEALSLLRSVRPNKGGVKESDLRLMYATGDILARAGRRKEATEEFRRIMQYDIDAFDAAERVAELN